MSNAAVASASTITFKDELSVDRESFGGKAASLGELTQAGFPVPPGFTVSTHAYTQFIAANGLDRRIVELLDGLDYGNATEVDDRAAAIRELIVSAPLGDQLAGQIADRYADLGADVHVAVRSSGTAEDMVDASFAGLHDTYLHICGTDAVIDAVRRCWASLWTARAVAYRHDKGFDNAEVRIAVVVQLMVDADVSGVLFTANPVNAQVDEFVVNASWGLGEAIVSGIVTPDEYVLDRDLLTVRRMVLGSKERQVIRDPETGAGTVTVDVPAGQRNERTLTEQQLAELGALGRKAMDAAGGFPQDIEWALADGSLYLLQSRPVTGVDFTWDEDVDVTVQPYAFDPDTVWTHSWADEFWTGAITPLFYSVREIEFGQIHRDWNELCGFDDVARMPFHKYRQGTVYFNTAIDDNYYRYILPRSLRAGNVGNVPPNRHEEMLKTPLDIVKYIRMLGRIAGLQPEQNVLRWYKVMDDYMTNRTAETEGPSAEELATMTDEQIKTRIAELMDLWIGFVGAEWCGFFLYAPTAFNALAWMLANWYDGENSMAFLDLLTGCRERTKTVEEGHVLWDLANTIKASPHLRTLFEENEGAVFFTALESSEEGREFLHRYRTELVAEHGHRGHADRDFIYTRRAEDPNLDYMAFRSLLTAADDGDPISHEEKLNKRREDAAAEVAANIRRKSFGALKEKAFTLTLDYAHRFLILRDNERHWLDRITLTKKRAFLELGRRLVERGMVEKHDDFYFLSIHEFYELLEGRGRVELSRAKIAARRRAFERVRDNLETPPAYLQHGMPVNFLSEGETDGNAIRGLGTSRGKVTGRARIVKDIKDIGIVEQDDILVCNSTDPGWTPVFMVISGLVLETGGMLAHGSCLSREYGLPAVTAAGATRLIPDGALIEVDGDAGLVTLLEAAEQ